MTDEEIMRTLAEFMGILGPNPETLRLSKTGKSWVRDIDGRGYFGDSDYAPLPDYLHSYDALAPVYLKAKTIGPCGGYELRLLVKRHLRKLAGWFPTDFEDWYKITPRQHAEALATAIQEHNQRSKSNG